MKTVRPGRGPEGAPRGVSRTAASAEGRRIGTERSADRGAPAPDLRPITTADIAKITGGAVHAPKKPRFRFAPSPTGLLHIGGARTALLNYLAAQKVGGELVLRIEDTDAKRSKPEFTDAIMRGLEWLGIRWTGEVVFQSKRTKLYQEKIAQLVAEKKAYKDPTGAVFFSMPDQGSLVIRDRVKGNVPINVSDANGMRDFVIQRSDGSPTFLLANVVDDGEQGVTHVIRGEDHLTNAARQICLFRALGYDVPELYHLPLIVDDNGAKLSKRHGASSIDDYRALGYTPDVMANHLARLGMGYGTELTLPLEELAQKMDLLRFSKAPTPIGIDALNARNLRRLARMPIPELVRELEARDPALAERLGRRGAEALADGARAAVSTFKEMVDLGRFLLEAPVYSEADRAAHGKRELVRLLDDLTRKLEALPAARWSKDELSALLGDFNAERKVKYAAYGRSLRWKLTGLVDGLPLHDTLAVLGRDEALARLRGHGA